MDKLKIVCISDTHNHHKKVIIPPCDILVHAGDFTSMGYKHEVEDFAKWLDDQPADHIVLTTGNHEKIMEKCIVGTSYDKSSRTWITDHCPRAQLLIHEACAVQGIKFFGSPYTPYFFNWAWNAGRTIAESGHYAKPFIGDLWSDIPEDTEFLITHGPAYEKLDLVRNWNDPSHLISVGCQELQKRIDKLPSIKHHVFGHIHTSPTNPDKHIKVNNVNYYNASICDERYKPINPITVINYEKKI